jgi:hypothetical protein
MQCYELFVSFNQNTQLRSCSLLAATCQRQACVGTLISSEPYIACASESVPLPAVQFSLQHVLSTQSRLSVCPGTHIDARTCPSTPTSCHAARELCQQQQSWSWASTAPQHFLYSSLVRTRLAETALLLSAVHRERAERGEKAYEDLLRASRASSPHHVVRGR